MKKTINATMAAFYAIPFLHDLIPIYPLYAVMFGDFGVSPFQLSILLAVWATWAMVLEVPTGGWADRYSRKHMLCLSGILQAGAYLTWIVLPTFWGFFAGFLLWGTAGALYSGTFEAVLHDSLAQRNQADDYTRIYGRVGALESLAGGLSMILGGMLIRFGYSTVLLISAAMPFIGALVAWALPEPPRYVPESETGAKDQEAVPAGYMRILGAGIREASSNRQVLFVILVMATLLLLPDELDEFVGPALKEKGFSYSAIGYLFGGVFVAKAIGNMLGHRLRRLSLTAFFTFVFAAGCILLLAVWGKGFFAAIAYATFFAIFGAASTFFAGKLQHSIQIASRATITSVNALMRDLMGTLILLSFGALASRWGMHVGVLMIAAATMLMAALFGAMRGMASPFHASILGPDDVEEAIIAPGD